MTSAQASRNIEQPIAIQETRIQAAVEQFTAPSISVSKHSMSISMLLDWQSYLFAIVVLYLGKHFSSLKYEKYFITNKL